MTNEQLSKRVAELYGIHSFENETNPYWLHDDSARIIDLADENGICTLITREHAIAYGEGINERVLESFKNHTTKSAAARIARLKCLIKIRE